MRQLLKIHARDNVAVALCPLHAGETVRGDGFSLTLRSISSSPDWALDMLE